MLIENTLTHTNKSLAVQRLNTVLCSWKNEKKDHGYQFLYICARNKGKKIKSLWIDSNEDVFSILEECFEATISKATSFEVEFLFNPQERNIGLSLKNQLNSFRGKYAVIVDFLDKTSKWSALEMIARNLSFTRVGSHHLALCNQRAEKDMVIPALIYQTKQFYCDNKPNHAELLKPEILYRGNKVVAIEDVNKNSLLTTIKGMITWLANQVNNNGQTSYKYWPSRGEQASSNNAIRQWMATICLNRAALAFNNNDLKTISELNLDYNLNETLKNDGTFSYIFMNGTAKLGSAALAALAIFESPKRQHYLKEEQALVLLFNELSNEDGSFDTFYIPRERKDNQNFYSGEALLYLATRFQITRNEQELNRFMSGFQYYRTWHFANRNPAFVPWHTQACFLVWQITKEPKLKDFIFEINDWLLTMQQWERADYADMKGRFYDPKRPFYGPPHASSTGVYLEGLIDAYQLAKECQDEQRREKYRVAILRGIRSIIQLQFKDECDCFYIQKTENVLGGIRTTVYDNTIRIDNVQHPLMAFLKISSRFSDDDFVLERKEVAKFKPSSFNYQYFRKIDNSMPIEVFKQEIELNDNLWLLNTSRQDNLKVQRETQTIFLRSGRKPVPPSISGNDIHPSQETNNAQFFPAIMRALYRFAKEQSGDLSRVTIVKLNPEGHVAPHIDEGDYYLHRDRYHIVIQSINGSEMAAGDEKLTWKEGEVWWFDNKAMHHANNHSDQPRIHIIFDILPFSNKSLIASREFKQKLLYSPKIVGGLKNEQRSIVQIHPSEKIVLAEPTPKFYSSLDDGKPFITHYITEDICIEEYQDVYLLGNKFVLLNENYQVLEDSLPSFQHQPDAKWINRKPGFVAALLANEIIEIDEASAVIANSSWKNYWHWHLQCLPNVSLLKDVGLFAEVKIIVPPLNKWREESLELMGVTSDKIYKARNSIIKFKKLYRPSLVNKKNQPLCNPYVHRTFSSLKNSLNSFKQTKKVSNKIYVARTDCPERRLLANENELINALKKHGFQIIIPSQLTYQQQIQIFSQAEIIIGCHGAGLTNLGFSSPDTTVIELFPEYFLFEEKMAYYTLASSMKMNYLPYCSTKLLKPEEFNLAKQTQQRCLSGNFSWLVDVSDFIEFLIENNVNSIN